MSSRYDAARDVHSKIDLYDYITEPKEKLTFAELKRKVQQRRVDFDAKHPIRGNYISPEARKERERLWYLRHLNRCALKRRAEREAEGKPPLKEYKPRKRILACTS